MTSPAEETIAATDHWFFQHGLVYFVPEHRAAVRAGLHPRRVVPLLVVAALVAAAIGFAVSAWADELSLLPSVLWTVFGVSATWYALTALRARSIVGWAIGRTFGSLRTLLPMMTRALPLLLVFVTFLFINAEVWQVSAHLDGGRLWLVALLFGTLAGAFLLVRLPEEVDRTDDHVDDELLLKSTADTPLAQAARDLVADPEARPASYAEIVGYERWNLILVLVVIQATQVLLLCLTVFAFFLVFGAISMNEEIVATWTGGPEQVHALGGVAGLTVELLQVSVFLAAFSSLYLTVSTVTDETYREQFFSSVLHELERAVGVRAVYLAYRDRLPEGLKSSD